MSWKGVIRTLRLGSRIFANIVYTQAMRNMSPAAEKQTPSRTSADRVGASMSGELRVGSIVYRAYGTESEFGVVFHQYESQSEPRWRIIFESGFHDSFGSDEVYDTGLVHQPLTSYQCPNQDDLEADWESGVFDLAFREGLSYTGVSCDVGGPCTGCDTYTLQTAKCVCGVQIWTCDICADGDLRCAECWDEYGQ